MSRKPGAYARADLARIAASSRRADRNTLRAVQVRQAAALAAYDRREAWRKARERLARLAVFCIGIALCVALFYAAAR